jgi:hypothetical protein
MNKIRRKIRLVKQLFITRDYFSGVSKEKYVETNDG